MKQKLNFINLWAIAACCSLFTLSCNKDASEMDDQTSNPTALSSRSNGQSANGQGGLLINDRVQHFAFHASKDEDGNVTGSWESKSPGQDIRTHGTITCLRIAGKIAILSGEITHIDGDGFPGVEEGDPVWFKVEDNGEGKNATDRFTDYFLGLGDCLNFNIALKPITNGNIQVKP